MLTCQQTQDTLFLLVINYPVSLIKIIIFIIVNFPLQIISTCKEEMKKSELPEDNVVYLVW